MTAVLVARNAIPNPKKTNAPNNNNKEINKSLNNTNPTTSASKTPTTNYLVTPNSTKSDKTNLEEKASLITSTPSTICTSSTKRSRSRSKSNPNLNANDFNDSPEISIASALNLLKEDNNITNTIKQEKISPINIAKKSKFDPTESTEYIEVPDDQSDDSISNEELDMISQLPGLECNHVKTDQRNNNTDDHEN